MPILYGKFVYIVSEIKSSINNVILIRSNFKNNYPNAIITRLPKVDFPVFLEYLVNRKK